MFLNKYSLFITFKQKILRPNRFTYPLFNRGDPSNGRTDY